MRGLADEALAAGTPPTQRCHVGLDPGLVDEYEPTGINPMLMSFPAGAAPSDVGTVLFAGAQAFFYGLGPVGAGTST